MNEVNLSVIKKYVNRLPSEDEKLCIEKILCNPSTPMSVLDLAVILDKDTSEIRKLLADGIRKINRIAAYVSWRATTDISSITPEMLSEEIDDVMVDIKLPISRANFTKEEIEELTPKINQILYELKK